MTIVEPTDARNPDETLESSFVNSRPPPLCQCSKLQPDLSCHLACSKFDAPEAGVGDLESHLEKSKGHTLSANPEAHGRFSQLPVEIGQKIFSECCEPFEAHPPSLAMAKNVESIAFGLASVCRAWRDLAYSTHVLWTSISLDVNSAHSNQVLCWRFDLGGQLPLSIYVHHNLPAVIAIAAALQQTTFLRDFVSHRINRIHTLVVDLPQQLLSAFDIRRAFESAALDELHLHGRSEDQNRYYDYLMPPIVFDNRIAVRKLCIESYPPKELFIKWGDIQELKLDHIVIDDVLPVLAQARQVSVVDIRLNGSDGLAAVPPLPVIMPQVKSLCVRDDFTIELFLPTCAMPLLTDLVIRSFTWFDRLIISFVSHCSSTLTNLRMECLRGVIYEDSVSLFEQCPNLINLDLRYLQFTDMNASRDVLHAIFERLTLPSIQTKSVSSSDQPLLRNLQSLKISVDCPLDWSTLVGLIASRQPACQAGDIEHLRNLSMYFIGDQSILMDLPCTGRVLELREVGCSITLHQFNLDDASFPNVDVVRESMRHHGLLQPLTLGVF